MPSLSHSPLASYNTKKTLKNILLTFFCQCQVLRLVKVFRSDRPFLHETQTELDIDENVKSKFFKFFWYYKRQEGNGREKA